MSRRVTIYIFLVTVGLTAAAGGIHEAIFNNFLADVHKLSAEQRGWLEFPRELPGFLLVFIVGLLCMLPVTRMGTVGCVASMLGMLGLAWVGADFWPMVLFMFIQSLGMHLLQPVVSSITLSFGNENNRGLRMGQMGAVGTAGMILGTGSIWLFFGETNPPYWLGFLAAGLVASLAAITYVFLHVPTLTRRRSRLVLHRRYSLYYLIEFVYGARKQIFLTFGPWVLIQVYGRPASSIAGLMMVAAIIGLVFKPMAGVLIDRFGERTVMICDGLLLSVICLGYGYAGWILPDAEWARWLASICYIGDHLLFALSSTKDIYLSRTAESPEDLTSTLSLGISINHIASMTVPVLAGAIWTGLGYERVFLCAAGLAIGISLIATYVPKKRIV
jgi:MFS family permease